jgi:alpha-mannosidase
MRVCRTLAIVLAGIWLCSQGVHSQQPAAAPKPTLYLIANSHLDTQWNWTVQDTIRQFVPSTFYDNFKLIERFPNYVFNYEGVIHYMWFKEYHPDGWPTLQQYVASGRWRLAGSWINAVDTNVPSPEALMRQALYGKRFFRQAFNKVSQDVYLPDCFGFGFALPSIAAHSGLTAFSTQKLAWGAATPTPFAVGLWKGVDGSSLVAALRGGPYDDPVRSDISTDPKWNSDLTELGDGKKVGFRYFGAGDIGGAPDPESVEWVEKAVANTQGAVEVQNTSADQLSRDLTDPERASLPLYQGELLLKTHGVGCYTSQAAMKTWNRRNELLADAAERASVGAEWVGGPAYPHDRLRTAWTRFLFHQFHDDLTGTCIPQAYQFSWNDELVSLNQFASILSGAVGSVASGLDTRPAKSGVGIRAAPVAPGEPGAPGARPRAQPVIQLTLGRGSGNGVPLVVYNPLAMSRRDPVEATVQFRRQAPAGVQVIDTATGEEVPSQVLSGTGTTARIVFLADVPAVGFKVFEARPSARMAPARPGTLKVTSSSLENGRYLVKLDANGDVASIFDKEAGSELLEAPARLELFDDYSARWPAWEILWDTVSKPPREYVKAPAIRVIERGPARVALEVTRRTAGSTFVQRIRLAEGGDRVEFDTEVDWRTPGTLLKASFPLTAMSPSATYDLGLGTIQRPNSTADLYEVPAQQWADITDAGGRFGVAILNDAKYGWDKPAANELRLTLIHTPMPKDRYVYQSGNDIGHHRFTYAIAGHRADWRAGRVPARAARLNQLPVAFQTEAHAGPLGQSIALLDLSDTTGQVAVRAFKKAEDSDELVIRVQELYGRPVTGLQIGLPSGIRQAREINGAEEPVGSATVTGGKLALDLKPYQPRSFAVTPGAWGARVAAITSTPVDLPFNLDGISTEANRADGDFDGHGRTFPAELLPQGLQVDGVDFRFGPTGAGAPNVVAAKGQRIALPAGTYNRVYILAAAVGGDARTDLTIERHGGAPARTTFGVQEWTGAIGQWDSRLRDDRMMRERFVPEITKDQSWPLAMIEAQTVTKWQAGAPVPVQGLGQIRPGFVKRDEVAWVATHRHAPQGNEIYIYGYVFKYGVDLPKGAAAIVLPDDERIRVFAMTLADEPAPGTWAAELLYAPDLRGAPAARSAR